MIIQARHVGQGDVGRGLGVVFDPQESESGHAEVFFLEGRDGKTELGFSLRGILELCKSSNGTKVQ